MCSVWHDTAIPFSEVLEQFEAWLTQHHLWGKELGGRLHGAAFVTWWVSFHEGLYEICKASTCWKCLVHWSNFLCWYFSGNWDLKTKVPDQCKVSNIKLPPYFMEWINLKDVFYNFYKTKKSEVCPHISSLMFTRAKIWWLNNFFLGGGFSFSGCNSVWVGWSIRFCTVYIRY